jgi:hypothetical protein
LTTPVPGTGRAPGCGAGGDEDLELSIACAAVVIAGIEDVRVGVYDDCRAAPVGTEAAAAPGRAAGYVVEEASNVVVLGTVDDVET